MTTAHRPTFDPARGKEALRGPAYHQRLLPAHTKLKFRQAGQGADADASLPKRDLAAEVLAAETAYFAKKKAAIAPALDLQDDVVDVETSAAVLEARGKRPLLAASEEEEEDMVVKRRRILEETREIDADDETDEEDDGDEDETSDDEEAGLQRELERVRREREDKRRLEEEERAKEEQEARERNIALGNPLLNKPDASVKRRWDDDVVFRNQARGTEERDKKTEFVNDLLRSDFHRRFMSKYVR